MKNVLPIIILSILFYLAIPTITFADIVNLNYYRKTCNPDEIEVECEYQMKNLGGPAIYDTCRKYRNSNSYRYLVGEGHSFGGKEKYCFKSVSIVDSFIFHINKLYPLVFITLLLEIPIWLGLIHRTRKVLFTAVFANILTVSLLYFVTVLVPYSGLLSVAAMELGVVIIEAGIFKLVFKTYKNKELIVASLVANLISYSLGSLLIQLIDALLPVLLTRLY